MVYEVVGVIIPSLMDMGTMIVEVSGHNRLRSQCLQIQLPTCC